MTTQTVLSLDEQAIANYSRKNNEPEWLYNIRMSALKQVAELELPKLDKTRIKQWKWDAYGTYQDQAKVQSVADLPENARSFLQSEQGDNLLVQQNVSVVYEHLSESLSSQGVLFMDLNRAVAEHGDLVQQYFMQAVKQDEHKLTAHHAAFWSSGLFLYVPRGVHVEVPLQGLFISDNHDAVFSPHLLIVAEEQSSVTYVDNTVSSVASSKNLVHNRVVEVFVKQGAKVNFASIHHLGPSVTDVSYRRAVVERDGEISWTIGELNDGNCLSDTTSVLKGIGSNSNSMSLSIGTGKQKMDLTTRAVHIGEHTNSAMLTHAVMTEESTAILNGITKMDKGASKSHGEQTERIMMLSPNARGDANPILLIDEDDVTAGHAASAGQVDPEQIYYLMSRGIERVDAERLLIYGFLSPIVSKVPIDHVSEQLQRLLERKLES